MELLVVGLILFGAVLVLGLKLLKVYRQSTASPGQQSGGCGGCSSSSECDSFKVEG